MIRPTIRITFILADGGEHTVAAEAGETLMRVAKRNNFSGVVAECGGACSCATCHVHIDKTWRDKLPPRESAETEMLEFAEGVDENSRLSCQINLTRELDGLIAHVPASQY